MPVTEFIVAGGLLKNKLLMQIYADVTGLQLSTIGSTQGPALGSAIHAAVAAGAYPDIRAAAAAMGAAPGERVHSRSRRTWPRYEELFQEYRTLHDYFGRGSNDVMHRLKAIQRERAAVSTPLTPPPCAGSFRMSALLESIARCPPRGLRTARRTDPLRAGGLDGRQRLGPRPRLRPMVIKPSGVSYDDLTPEIMVVTDLYGTPVSAPPTAGDRREQPGPAPSSDTAAHAYVYRNMPDVGGVVHTHSTYATAWAARGRGRSPACSP